VEEAEGTTPGGGWRGGGARYSMDSKGGRTAALPLATFWTGPPGCDGPADGPAEEPARVCMCVCVREGICVRASL
jgi:hypothetical protein